MQFVKTGNCDIHFRSDHPLTHQLNGQRAWLNQNRCVTDDKVGTYDSG